MSEDIIATIHPRLATHAKRAAGWILAHWTPERVREAAEEGHPRLAALERNERFTGVSLVMHDHRGKMVHLRRAASYRDVVFDESDPESTLHVLIDKALNELGRELEDRSCPTEAQGCTCILYSAGPAPQILDDDGVIVSTRPDGTLHLRCGYYAQMGCPMHLDGLMRTEEGAWLRAMASGEAVYRFRKAAR